eukprot:6765387-Pyramimonas_sp.AAC.1
MELSVSWLCVQAQHSLQVRASTTEGDPSGHCPGRRRECLGESQTVLRAKFDFRSRIDARILRGPLNSSVPLLAGEKQPMRDISNNVYLSPAMIAQSKVCGWPLGVKNNYSFGAPAVWDHASAHYFAVLNQRGSAESSVL